MDRRARRVLALRVVLVLGGLGTLGIAAGFLLGWPAVTRYWPYPTYGLTRVFLASIFAAIGAPVVWIGLSREFAALRGGSLNIVVTAGGTCPASISRTRDRARSAKPGASCAVRTITDRNWSAPFCARGKNAAAREVSSRPRCRMSLITPTTVHLPSASMVCPIADVPGNCSRASVSLTIATCGESLASAALTFPVLVLLLGALQGWAENAVRMSF